MGGEFTAQSPSGLSGNDGTKILFTIVAYRNDRMMKNLGQDQIKSFDQIRTLVITGHQSRDEEVLSSLHKSGLNLSVTTFQKSTTGQIKANLNIPEDRYGLIVILDDREFNGLDTAASLWESNLSGSYVIMIISSNDVKGNYLKSITMGVDHYLVQPVDENEIREALLGSFPNIESPHTQFDASRLRTDIEILVVEDNMISQKVIATMLKTLGYGCDIAENGQDAQHQVRRRDHGAAGGLRLHLADRLELELPRRRGVVLAPRRLRKPGERGCVEPRGHHAPLAVLLPLPGAGGGHRRAARRPQDSRPRCCPDRRQAWLS